MTRCIDIGRTMKLNERCPYYEESLVHDFLLTSERYDSVTPISLRMRIFQLENLHSTGR
jgi:hypothetical protein